MSFRERLKQISQAELEGESMVAQFAKRLRTESFAAGEIKGERRGERRGEIKAKHEMAQNLLRMGFPMEKVVQATKLSEEEIRNL